MERTGRVKSLIFLRFGRIADDNTDNKPRKRQTLEEDQDASNATGLGCTHA